MKIQMIYSNYSQKAMEDVVSTSKGKPLTSEGQTIGYITDSKIIGPDLIEHDVELVSGGGTFE